MNTHHFIGLFTNCIKGNSCDYEKDPKVAFLIFTSGKIVCVGAKSDSDVHQAIQQLLREIKELGFGI